MITLLGSLFGFIAAFVPDLFKIYQSTKDRAHELAIMDRQIAAQKQGAAAKLEEINATASMANFEAIYKTYSTGIRWVDAFNGTVRPALAYAFFVLYAVIKIMLFRESPMPWLLWTEEDQAVFAAIISFYFGQRSSTAKAKK